MKRLYLTVEGQTEQQFAVTLLQPHLATASVYLANPCLTGLHGRKGGRIPGGGMLGTFVHAFKDMRRWQKEDQSADARFSMMVDLYGLPNDFPSYAAAMRLTDPFEQVKFLEEALAKEMNDQRFIPYLQLHEFEALILAEPLKIGESLEVPEKKLKELAAAVQAFKCPELVNHGQQSHPKALIKKYVPDYDEKVDGNSVAEAIGLATLRDRCPHFGSWLTQLENLD